MSTTRNADSVTNAQGEFHPSVQRDEPLTTHGHKPGALVGNDAVPTFSAQTLPAGTAPSDRTFEPNSATEIPSQASHPSDADKDAPFTSAADTLGGATSADVHTGLGKPLQGQTSTEVRHEGQHHRENPGGHGAGLVGTGASGAASTNQLADNP
ncbi:hypothetical protein MMC07_007742 [Pseudocyphellaria aurata]|nr:hypothetical protein [Pseudocyphellaria aurata]